MTKENLLRAINKYHLKSLSSLRSRLRAENYEFEDAELDRLLKQLASEGQLNLVGPGMPLPQVGPGMPLPPTGSFREYLRDFHMSSWVYLVILVGGAESVLVGLDSQNPVLLVLRGLFGVLLLGFAPGYATTKAIFPAENFQFLETIVLSVFLSLVVSIGIGTLLGAFLLFDAESSTFLIGLSTVTLGLVGAYRGSSQATNRPVPSRAGSI